jgi:hypothetical protein
MCPYLKLEEEQTETVSFNVEEQPSAPTLLAVMNATVLEKRHLRLFHKQSIVLMIKVLASAHAMVLSIMEEKRIWPQMLHCH